MDHSRRAQIEKAVETVSRPVELRGRDKSDLAVKAIRKFGTDMRPHEIDKIARQLPYEHRVNLGAGIKLLQEHRDMGRYGAPVEAVAHVARVAPDVLAIATDLRERDEIVDGLMAKRGTDAALPPPELTRRDIVEAALESHQYD